MIGDSKLVICTPTHPSLSHTHTHTHTSVRGKFSRKFVNVRTRDQGDSINHPEFTHINVKITFHQSFLIYG